MSVKNYPVMIGARGWLHPRWDDEYYPQDLPGEWRLTFYANEFPVAVVPATDWEELSELATWVDDTDGKCAFVLELSPASLQDETRLAVQLEKARALAGQCLGFLLPMQSWFLQQPEKLKSLVDLIQPVAALCLDDNERLADAAMLDWLAEQGVGRAWYGETEADSLLKGKIAVVKIAETQLPPRRLRTILEACLAASSDTRSVVLCFTAESVDIELLHNADTMLGLM